MMGEANACVFASVHACGTATLAAYLVYGFTSFRVPLSTFQ
jgi:hypothetical protein